MNRTLWTTRVWLPALLAATALVQPAHAAPIRFEGSGTVGNIVAVNGAATGSVALGDTLRFGFTFDPSLATRIFDGGRATQAFALPLSDIVATVGSFSFTPDPNQSTPPVLVIGNAFRFDPSVRQSVPVFVQSFYVPGLATGALPFTAGQQGGVTFSLSSFFRFDHGGVVPTLADLRDPSAAWINTFDISVGENGRTSGYLNGSFTGSFTALAAVPEPEAWALLILGFGVIGAGMRARRPRRLAVP